MKTHGLNPRIKKFPYFEASVRAGATEFHPYNGMWMPVGYDTPVNEYWNLITNAGLWDVSVQRVIEISGPDANAFINHLTPRQLDGLTVGGCRYVMLTNQDGGIVNDPVLLKLADDRFWLSTADSDVYLWAKGVGVHAGFDAQVGAPDVSTLQIQGPTSAAIVADAFGDHILDLGYYQWVHASLDRMDVIISRTGYSAEVGFEVYLVGSKRAEELWDRILTIGKPHGLAPGSPNRIRRIEAGILDWGSDIDVDTNPYELGMSRMVALDKPYPFIGKEALSAIAASGPRRRLTGLVLDGRPLEKNNEHRWEVTSGQARAGEVTAAVHSPRLGQNIALAILDVESPTADLVVDTPEGRRGAEVSRIPFIDPDKEIPRQSLR